MANCSKKENKKRKEFRQETNRWRQLNPRADHLQIIYISFPLDDLLQMLQGRYIDLYDLHDLYDLYDMYVLYDLYDLYDMNDLYDLAHVAW